MMAVRLPSVQPEPLLSAHTLLSLTPSVCANSHHACAGKKVKEALANFKSGNATKIEKTIVKKMADGGADGRAPAQPKPLPSAQSLLSLTQRV